MDDNYIGVQSKEVVNIYFKVSLNSPRRRGKAIKKPRQGSQTWLWFGLGICRHEAMEEKRRLPEVWYIRVD
jgi:hypothetical protein